MFSKYSEVLIEFQPEDMNGIFLALDVCQVRECEVLLPSMPKINMEWKQGCKPMEQGCQTLKQGWKPTEQHSMPVEKREGIFNVTLVFHGKNNLIIILTRI
jgi:hypothetical protein